MSGSNQSTEMDVSHGRAKSRSPKLCEIFMGRRVFRIDRLGRTFLNLIGEYQTEFSLFLKYTRQLYPDGSLASRNNKELRRCLYKNRT